MGGCKQPPVPPQVVGLFGNGRIEAFLPCKTLTPEEMAHPGFVPHIAARLRAFHDLPGMDSAFPTASTINSTSASASAPTSAAAAGAAAATAGPQPHAPSPQSSQWDAIFGWLDMAEQLSFAHDPAKQAAFDKVGAAGAGGWEPGAWHVARRTGRGQLVVPGSSLTRVGVYRGYGVRRRPWSLMSVVPLEFVILAAAPYLLASCRQVDFAAMRAELAQLKELCDRVASPRVFCHNDLLSGNILVIAPSASPAAAAPEPSASDGARCKCWIAV